MTDGAIIHVDRADYRATAVTITAVAGPGKIKGSVAAVGCRRFFRRMTTDTGDIGGGGDNGIYRRCSGITALIGSVKMAGSADRTLGNATNGGMFRLDSVPGGQGVCSLAEIGVVVTIPAWCARRLLGQVDANVVADIMVDIAAGCTVDMVVKIIAMAGGTVTGGNDNGPAIGGWWCQ